MDTTIRIDLAGRSYAVHVGSGLLEAVGERSRETAGGSRALLVTNPAVAGFYEDRVAASLAGAGYAVHTELVPDTERAKSVSEAERLWRSAVGAGLERTDPIIALGGGVVGDLAGFVAATYMRGVPFVQVPTTLLSQVDSSVGGKVAVDLPEGKNLVGAFWQPRVVVADVSTLDTLDGRELVAGAAEVVKTALLAGGELLEFVGRRLDDLVAGDHDVLARAVSGSVGFKARIVEEDETDQGRRAILNLGHTVGHAIEQQAGYGQVLHGEAVALGIEAESHVAELMGVSASDAAERQRALCRRLGLGLPRDLDVDGLVTQMYRDKKTSSGSLRMVLLAEEGRPEVADVPEDTARAGLACFIEKTARRSSEGG